jgi:hypothetical protein
VHVVFDQSLDQVSTPFDTAYEGMSLLAGLLRRHGASVSLSSLPLDEFLPGFAGPGRVLVLGIPWKRRYTAAGLAAVRDFLAAGGGVLVITEHDDIYGHTGIQNELIAPYGITSLPENAPGRADEAAPEGRIWPLCRAPRWGFDAVRLFMPAPLRVSAPAEPLLEIRDPDRPEARVVGALSRAAGGPLVVLADLEILWNMSATSGVNAAQNAAFLMRLFGLLAGREAGLEPRALEPRIEAWRDGARLALFDSSGLGWYPDGAPHGLSGLAERLHGAGYRIEVGGGPTYPYERVDLLVSVSPIARIDAERMREASRLLLVADGRSSLMRAEPEFVKAFLRTLRGTRYVYPLDSLTTPLGFSFLPVTLLSRETSSMRALAHLAQGGGALPLHRSSVIAIVGEGDPRPDVRAVADRRFYASVNLTPVLYGDWRTNPSRRPLVVTEEGRTLDPLLPVIVATPRVMAIADLELVTDEVIGTPEGEAAIGEILRWLGGSAADEPARPGG